MMRALACGVIVCVGLLLFSGWLTSGPDRLGVSTIQQTTLLTVVITFKHITDEYRSLSVHGCSADLTDSGAFCNGNFDRESSLELFGRKQELIDWRRVPRGSLLITAQAFNQRGKVLAAGQTVVLRGE